MRDTNHVLEDDTVPEAYPNPDWTPKQKENWVRHGLAQYELLESDEAKEWYRRIWRPKQRNEGMMKRDHVKLGTPEDYIEHTFEKTFQPMANLTGEMMRVLGTKSNVRAELDEVVSELVQARKTVMALEDPEMLERIQGEAEHLAELYGLADEVDCL